MKHTPWLVPDAIKFLGYMLDIEYQGFLQGEEKATVLETGAGGSTIWFAERAKSVLSYEHNLKFYNEVARELKRLKITNVSLIYDPKYPKLGLRDNTISTYDIILIDGRGRVGTINQAIKLINPGGYIILDNAERERYKPGVKLLNSLFSERAIFTKDWTTAFWRNIK